MEVPARRRKRLLVVSNETVEAGVLHDTIVARAGATEVAIVAPALNSRLRHWFSDEDPARHAAAARLDRCMSALGEAGVRVDGWVGDADPIQAIADALAAFPAEELLIVTHPDERSNWLAHDLVARACARFSLPVVHLVVDGVRAAAPVLVAACRRRSGGRRGHDLEVVVAAVDARAQSLDVGAVDVDRDRRLA